MKLPKEENVLYSGHNLISQDSQELYQPVPVQRQDIIQTSGLCNDIPTTSKRHVSELKIKKRILTVSHSNHLAHAVNGYFFI